jgi:hypothetical protein
MSPVHIDELNPETRARARVIQQIGETEGTTALAISEDNNHSSTYSPAEMRARSIISRMASLCDKLKTIEADIRLLWADFDNLKAGETILGCATKKEFCEKKLHRTPQAIRYMLNPELRESKHCLPPDPQPPTPVPAARIPASVPDAEFVDVPQSIEPEIPVPSAKPTAQPIPQPEPSPERSPEPKPEPTPEPKPERTLEDVLDKLVERIVLQPYGYSAAKFKMYPQQHTVDLMFIALRKETIWQRIVEIGQAKSPVPVGNYALTFYAIRYKASGYFVQQGPNFSSSNEDGQRRPVQSLRMAHRLADPEVAPLQEQLVWTVKELSRQTQNRKLHLKPEDFEVVEVQAAYTVKSVEVTA